MDAIEQLLTRGVDTIYPNKAALEHVLRSGKKLTLYQGFDPTGTQLHIGHAVSLRKLRQFQDLGHHVIFLIGDGTGQAGDPSGKKKSREKFFTQAELKENAVNYVHQAGKIVRFTGENPVEIRFNSDWLNKLTLVDVLNIAQHFSVQQLIERDMFQERLKHNESINLREFLYPLLQGYDSVALNVDLELGGTDQTFNMLAGRTLAGAINKKEKFVMTTPLLTDAKGVKIGKSEGNVIAIADEASSLYGKIMSLGDEAIIPALTLLTDTDDEEIKTIAQEMQTGKNPMSFKKHLAHMITTWLHTKDEADRAQSAFEQVFQQRQAPETDMPIFTTKEKTVALIDLLTGAGDIESKSEARRLIEQGAVEQNGQTITKETPIITINNDDIIKIGKKKFIQIKIIS